MKEVYHTINPSTETIISEYQSYSDSEIQLAINTNCNTQKIWKDFSFQKRSDLLLNLSELLLNNKHKYSELMALEMGKPITQGIAEIEKSSWVCRYYAENSEEFLQDRHIQTEKKSSYVTYLPLGTIYAIMPWNFPFWQVFRCTAPNIMAGNTILLKHAPNTPECSTAISNLFLESGFPQGVLEHLIISPEFVQTKSELIISDSRIKGVTLTGSTNAGRNVASLAGKYLKKAVLELGGSDAYIIFNDADLETAASVCALSRMNNTGQTCIAAKRFIVSNDIKEEFTKLFIKYCSEFVPGDPMNSETKMGPMARKDLRTDLQNHVENTIKSGGKLLLGGDIPQSTGYYYPPTIITDINADSIPFKEEIFGPVASIIGFDKIEDAINLANSTNFGLGASVFTRNESNGEEIAKSHLNAGCCFVNDMVKSDPRLPFGGINESGFGRELGEDGIKEFTNIKTIVVA